MRAELSGLGERAEMPKSWRPFKTKGEDESYLQENINWKLLRGFGASPVASITAAMPFVGYLIIYNSNFSMILGDLGGLIESDPSAVECPNFFSPIEKLNLLYLGLLTMGISAVIFKLFAPTELKLYRDVNQFIEAERQNLSARRLRSMYRTVNYRRPRIGEELRQRASWLHSDVQISKASAEFSNNKNEDLILDLMRSFFQAQDRHCGRTQVILCLLMFAIGSTLLFIPSASFTLRVLCVIF